MTNLILKLKYFFLVNINIFKAISFVVLILITGLVPTSLCEDGVNNEDLSKEEEKTSSKYSKYDIVLSIIGGLLFIIFIITYLTTDEVTDITSTIVSTSEQTDSSSESNSDDDLSYKVELINRFSNLLYSDLFLQNENIHPTLKNYRIIFIAMESSGYDITSQEEIDDIIQNLVMIYHDNHFNGCPMFTNAFGRINMRNLIQLILVIHTTSKENIEVINSTQLRQMIEPFEIVADAYLSVYQ